MARVADALDTVPANLPLHHRLCEAVLPLLTVQGASISLSSGGAPTTLYATNDVAAEVEELQFTTGEGPCIEVVRDGKSVQAADVSEVRQRWPAFASGLTPGDVNAMFAFPLRMGAAVIGALDCYRTKAGLLSDEERGDCLALAQLLTKAVLDVQADAPGDSLATDLDAGAWDRAEIHQAAGMISVQLQIPVGDALVRLRAHAFRHGQSVGDVATAVVLRLLTITANDEGNG